jgi:translocator protein
VLAAAPSLIASVLGAAATTPNIPVWYEGLAKPPLTPPNWVFGPIWTVLYIVIAYAFFRILSAPPDKEARASAITLFLVQMALNVTWSFAFFAAHSTLAGLIVIVALNAAVHATILRFSRVDRIASFALWPYAAWVAFATYLNLATWLLNR